MKKEDCDKTDKIVYLVYVKVRETKVNQLSVKILLIYILLYIKQKIVLHDNWNDEIFYSKLANTSIVHYVVST